MKEFKGKYFIKIYDKETGKVSLFITLAEAAEYLGYTYSTLYSAMYRKGTLDKKYKIERIERERGEIYEEN